MSPQERLPRHSPFSDRVESVLEQDPFDRISTDLVSQVVERASDSGVAVRSQNRSAPKSLSFSDPILDRSTADGSPIADENSVSY